MDNDFRDSNLDVNRYVPEENPYASDCAYSGYAPGNDSGESNSCSYEWPSERFSHNNQVNTEHPSPKEKKPKGRMPVALILILSMVFSIAFGGGAGYLVYSYQSSENDKNSTKTEYIYNYVGEDETNALSTEAIVEKFADSVVEIITEIVETGAFTKQYIKSGAGSGVIVDEEGLILTNYHVIEGATKVTVTLRSGESLEAEILGVDPRLDLAVISVSYDNLVAASFGDSDELKVGERTIAIGNPLGQLGGTVTEGILSALDRDVVVDGQTMSLLQTDTAINPGNSGGGLFNAKGQLIGIVSAKSAGSEVEGLGFAIPINDAIDVMGDLAEYGYVRGRVDVGMEFIDVDSVQTAWMYGLSELGCYIYSVDRGSNADGAGFESGDLVVRVEHEEIETAADIENIINSKAVGDIVDFTIVRNGRTKEITLELEELVPDEASSDDTDNEIYWGYYESFY